MRDENTCRQDFAPTEAVALGLALEKLERPKAAERMAQAPGQKQGAKVSGGKLPQENGKTRDKVGAGVGLSGRTYPPRAAIRQVRSIPDGRR